MARSSRADTARHHEELIGAAARLFRARGVSSVSVLDVMGAVGMTKGGFYKHFDSKEALVAAAVGAAFSEHSQRLATMAEQNSRDRARTREAFVDFCLSTAHRDDPATGCPSALASSMAHSAPDGAPRAAYIEGTRTFLRELIERAVEDDEDTDADASRERALADLSTIVGALLLARATAGDPMSEEFLASARRRLD